MSFNYYSDSLEDIHQALMMTLYDDFDYESSPRGKPIRELIAASFTLADPRNRLITSPARAVNYGFAVGELCWYIRGDHDLETMLYYNKRMGQFSDDGKTINSAYGSRIFNPIYGVCPPGKFIDHPGQFDLVIEELKSDPDSRRAVMHINQPRDLGRAVGAGSKDVPCTMSLQLLIRDRKLHMHVLMRSNDVVWGLPYDVFSFTCLQEAFLYMLQEKGVPVDDLGSYHHTAGSLHVYDTHFSLAKEVAGEDIQWPAPMKPFTLDLLQKLGEDWEPRIRTSTVDRTDITSVGDDTIGWMVDRLIEHRLKRDEEAKKKAEREKALDELIQMTEEMGLYKEKDEQQT